MLFFKNLVQAATFQLHVLNSDEYQAKQTLLTEYSKFTILNCIYESILKKTAMLIVSVAHYLTFVAYWSMTIFAMKASPLVLVHTK